MIRPLLNHLYTTSGYLAAASLLALLLIILLQILARWLNIPFPGSTNYAGYLMASASFLALGYALRHDTHIRVNLLLSRLGKHRPLGEIWCYTIGTLLTAYFAYYAIKTNYLSYTLNDISQGQDALPLWLPQLPMSLGCLILLIAMTDHLITAIRTHPKKIKK